MKTHSFNAKTLKEKETLIELRPFNAKTLKEKVYKTK